CPGHRHESGHAVVALVVKHSDSVDKVTIIPRGMSLGATHFMPKKNRVSYWRNELLDQLAILMGGRVAEEIFVGDMSSGAQMDISQATKIVRSMVCEWGMSDKLGTVNYNGTNENVFLARDMGHSTKYYSEHFAAMIDEEVRSIITKSLDKGRELVKLNSKKLEAIAKSLLSQETITQNELKEIMDSVPSKSPQRTTVKTKKTNSLKPALSA
ncbi:MAG: cell division protein FtsH, partial [Alphaproteobacteria bacterium]|nr:cell division protein FtsH [Alphaproteobacteria bacterium]